jgi:hypothetical protein
MLSNFACGTTLLLACFRLVSSCQSIIILSVLIFTTQDPNGTSNGGLHAIAEYETVIKKLRDENSSLKER